MSKRVVLSSFFCSLAAIALIALNASPALALKEFKDAFKAKYIKPDSTDPKDKALAAAFEKASCTVCHVPEKSKKNRNDYGKQLATLISKKDKKNTEKISKARDTVAQMKIKPKDPKSPTYGDKISSGKLPAAE